MQPTVRSRVLGDAGARIKMTPLLLPQRTHLIGDAFDPFHHLLEQERRRYARRRLSGHLLGRRGPQLREGLQRARFSSVCSLQ